jgi:hypothetical protein
MNQAFENYKALVDAQEVKPTKARIVQLRKSLIALKKACDNERLVLLNKPKPETMPEPTTEPVVEPVVEVESIPEMLPLKREFTVGISSDQPVESVEVKTDKKKRKKTKKL